MGRYIDNSGAPVGGGSGSTFKFRNAASAISAGDIVTLAKATGTVQRANAQAATLLGEKGVMALATEGDFANVTGGVSAGFVVVTTAPNGSIIMAARNEAIPAGAESFWYGQNQAVLVRLDGDTKSIIQTKTFPWLTAGGHIIDLGDGRIGLFYRDTSSSAVKIKVIDANTLDQIGADVVRPLHSTTTTLTPLSDQNSIVCRLSNGNIGIAWYQSSSLNTAILGSDLSLAREADAFGWPGGMPTMFRLSDGRSIFYMDYSNSVLLVLFDAEWNRLTDAETISGVQYRSTTNLTNFLAANLNRRKSVGYTGDIQQIDNNRFALCTYRTSDQVRLVRIYNVSAGTFAVEKTISLNSTSGDMMGQWFCHEGRIYFVYHASGTLLYKSFDIDGGSTSAVASGTLIAAGVSQYHVTNIGVAGPVSFILDGVFWFFSSPSSSPNLGRSSWYALEIDGPTLKLKRFVSASSTGSGYYLDYKITRDRVLMLCGGNTDSDTRTAIFLLSVNLATGAQSGNPITISAASTGGAAAFAGDYIFNESVSPEELVLIGTRMGVANTMAGRSVVKPIESILLGVAAEDASVGDDVSIQLDGWVAISERYEPFQKTIDHQSESGNRLRLYGSAGHLAGSQ